MGFKQIVERHLTDAERKTKHEEIKANLDIYKNPFASQIPFKDGEKLIFDDIVEVVWTHQKWGTGRYLALSFVGMEPTISLTSFLKKVEGYENFEIKRDDKARLFSNEGGFAEWISCQKWDANIIDGIIKWFNDRQNKVEVKLTYFYIPNGSSRKCRGLINLI